MSEVKVNKISPRTNCGTVTLGDSGDTFTIPAGVTLTNSGTATGFGPTGAVSWDTTPKTTTVTAVSGTGYFVDTTSGAVTVNLPAGVAGSIVAISAIDLLKAFMHASTPGQILTNTQMAWMVGIHATFIISGVLFAIMDKIAEDTPHH